MGQVGSGQGNASMTNLDGLGFDESMQVLRMARAAFSGMCRVIAEESGIKVVPSFDPDQADWCSACGCDGDADWSVRVGFDGCSSYRLEGTYEELCREWVKGPESLHDWLGRAVLEAAGKVVDDDEHEVPADESDELDAPSARSVSEARVGLTACGYLVSPAAIPEYMGVCSFVAWKGDTLVFVAVTDDGDEAARSEALASDVSRWREESGSDREDVAAVVVSVDDGRLSTTDVAI